MCFELVDSVLILIHCSRYHLTWLGYLHVRESRHALLRDRSLMISSRGYAVPSGSMIGALRWISYINVRVLYTPTPSFFLVYHCLGLKQPLRYGFEAVLANEFHTLNGSCASLVPQGPGYDGVSLVNQVCATVGAVPGENFVDGNKFIALSYGYSYANTWKVRLPLLSSRLLFNRFHSQNFGIVIAFGVAFITALPFFTELNTSSSTDTSMVLYKRGTKAVILDEASADEEKADAGGNSGARVLDSNEDKVEAEKALAEQPPMTDVFSWQHICYDVPVQGGERRLLNDVSGFVAPGKVTALMGESGAGKVSRRYQLAITRFMTLIFLAISDNAS